MARRLAVAAATTVAVVGVAFPVPADSPASEPSPQLPTAWAGGCIIPAVLWLDRSDPTLCPPAPTPSEPFSIPPAVPELLPPGACMTPALYTGPQPGAPCPPMLPQRKPWPLVPCFTPAGDGVIPEIRPGC